MDEDKNTKEAAAPTSGKERREDTDTVAESAATCPILNIEKKPQKINYNNVMNILLGDTRTNRSGDCKKPALLNDLNDLRKKYRDQLPVDKKITISLIINDILSNIYARDEQVRKAIGTLTGGKKKKGSKKKQVEKKKGRKTKRKMYTKKKKGNSKKHKKKSKVKRNTRRK